MLPVLYEFPEDIANDPADPPAWQDSSKWWMVTPNRDRSVTIKRLEDDWAQAKVKGQGEIIRWASQHLNIEIGLGVAVGSLGRRRSSGSGPATRVSPWTLCSSGARWW